MRKYILIILLISGLVFAEETLLTALGIGLPPARESNSAKAMLLAKKAARVDAERNLIEMIYGIRLNASTTLKDLVVEKEELSSRTTGYIKNSIVVSEKQNEDGSYEVVVGIPWKGKNSLSEYAGTALEGEFDFYNNNIKSTLVEKINNGHIDWGADKIIATGTGVSSEESLRARVLARRAALVDAGRNLLETLRGVHIDSKTLVKDLELSSDVVNKKLEGFVQGYRILDEDYNEGVYTLTLGVKLWGETGLQGVITQNTTVSENSTRVTPLATEGYSSLIIEARGLPLQKSLFPAVMSVSGADVYSTHSVSSTFLGKLGFVEYVDSLDKALASPRAGSKPLIIRPLQSGNQQGTNVILLSEENALKIKMQNEKTHFLEQLRVLIVTQ